MIIKAVLKKFHYVILFPVVVGAIVFYMQRQKPREYQSGMVFYTGLVSGQNLSQQGDGRTDYFAVNTAFDNLMAVIHSRETLEEVAMRLLATHLLMEKPDPFKVSSANYARLHKEMLTDDLISDLTEGRRFDVTLERIRRKYRQSETNEIIRLLNVTPGFYNVENINSNLTARRKRNSDMLEVIYRSSDPGVCFLTLQILAETFVEKNQALRNYEASGIIDYFRAELQRARYQLNEAEERLKEYSQQNQIINYSEQTKYLAAAKEDLEKDIYRENANMDAAREAISKLEQSFDQRERLYVNSREMLRKRDELAAIHTQIASVSISDRAEDQSKLAALKEDAVKLEREMYNLAQEYASMTYTRESLPRQNLINQWLANVLELDKSRARLEVLNRQRNYFDELFDRFAPIGFNLSKMEREIDIAEREYLSILHGLNQARIRQSDFELFGTIELLDTPFFPLNPQASRTRMLVAAALVASAFFVIGLIVTVEVLDRSLRTPKLAEANTGLEPLGVFAAPHKSRAVDVEQLEHRLFNLLCNQLVFSLRQRNPDALPGIIVFSTKGQDCIVNATLIVASALKVLYGDVACLCEETPVADQKHDETKKAGDKESINNTDTAHNSNKADSPENNNDGKYDQNTDKTGSSGNPYSMQHAFKYETYSYLDDNMAIKSKINAIISQNKAFVIQLPEFERLNLTEFLRLEPFMGVLVVNARQTWEYQDKKMLESLKTSFPDALYKLMVCQMRPDHLDDFLGEVPRKRSFLRRWAKKMIKLNF